MAANQMVQTLNRLMRERGMKQRELAHKADIDSSQLSRIFVLVNMMIYSMVLIEIAEIGSSVLRTRSATNQP